MQELGIVTDGWLIVSWSEQCNIEKGTDSFYFGPDFWIMKLSEDLCKHPFCMSIVYDNVKPKA